MKYLSVPAMFSEDYLEKLNRLNALSTDIKIDETYGSIPGYLIGSIRPSKTIKSISKIELIDYIKKSNFYGIGFNYTMNSTVIGDFEFNESAKKELINFIQEMTNAGLSKITVSIPYLIKFIKEYFPSLHVVASICIGVDSILEIERIKKLGADSVVLAKDINRDFKKLREIIANTKDISIKLLCTTPCVFKCTDLIYHMNISSLQDNVLTTNEITPQVPAAAIGCQIARLTNPVEFLKSPWIRPEDLVLYENIGINYFKLDGRDKPEEYLLEVIEAYMAQHYNGNFLYLIQGFYPKNLNEFNNLQSLSTFKIGVFLDNTKLNKFIKGFYDEVINCNIDCAKCNYCNHWKDEALKLDDFSTSIYIDYLKNK